jgi:hypothetical protein
VVLVLGRMLEIRDKILWRENLPVGIFTGPKSIITDVIMHPALPKAVHHSRR